MRPRIRFYGIRNFLLQVNTDLFKIQYACDQASDWEELNTLEIMVLILEDRRFFLHLGFDWISLLREIIKAATFRRHGGASTIDMQLVRTITGYRELTVRRKVYEILLAILLQIKFNKLQFCAHTWQPLFLALI
jgi:membrane carboxypeptidase/penicillin-binding protein PbpC